MRTLKKESTGPDVTALQQRLKDLGFDPKGVDGRFGSGTEAAVIAFQKANGLDADGKVGPNTRAALKLDQATTATPLRDYLRVEYLASVSGKTRTPSGIFSIEILLAPVRMSRAFMP